MSNRRDEPTFEELMAMEGVVPLEGQHRAGRGGAARQGAPPDRPRARAQTRPAKPGAGRTRRGGSLPPERPTGPGSGRAAPPGAARAAPPAQDARREEIAADSARLQQELASLRARVERAEAEETALRAALAQTQSDLALAQTDLVQARTDLAHARTDLTQIRNDRAEYDKVDAERRQLHEQCRRLRADLAEARQAATHHTPLQTVLEDRGLVDVNEMILALSGLLSKRPQELLDAVALADPKPLATLLEQRVALVHDDGGANLTASVIVRVPPDRCEITGGSDIRGAFRRLLDACQTAAEMHEITIVGGSPAYRQQLKELAEPHRAALRLNLVSGTRRRTRRRAVADMRKSDLVVIWGATELDHSVSAVYTGEGAPILRVPHRGISRMLDQVAESVRGHRG